MTIVSDAGPILTFLRADLLRVMQAVTGELIVPDAVSAELVVDEQAWPDSRIIEQANWIKRQSVFDRNLVEQLPGRLHAGEREAVVLAQQLHAALLIDERGGRKIAQSLGITYFGSLRILELAKSRGIIPLVKPTLDQVLAAGYYLSPALYDRFLLRMQEA
jgi:predicted nucleic acid-binding protein